MSGINISKLDPSMLAKLQQMQQAGKADAQKGGVDENSADYGIMASQQKLDQWSVWEKASQDSSNITAYYSEDETNGEQSYAGATLQDGAGNTQEVSVESGMAQADAAEKDAENCKKQTEEVEAQGKEAKNLQKEAKAAFKSLQRDEKDLNKQYNSTLKTFESEQKELQKLQEQAEQEQQELKQLQSEAEKLQGSNKPEDQEKLKTISARMNAIAANQESYTVKIKATKENLSTTQTKMNTQVKMKQKYYTKMLSTANEADSQNSKIEKFAQKVSDISTTVKNVGNVTQKVGQVMIATGTALSSTVFGAAAGAALIKAGGVVTKVGKTVETVGTCGVAASQVTLAATAAAQGDIGKFISSAASAVQTAGAAVKGVKNLSADIKQIDQTLEQATTQAAESREIADSVAQKVEGGGAADVVDGASGDAAGGLTTATNPLNSNGTNSKTNWINTAATIAEGVKDVAGEINKTFGTNKTAAAQTNPQTSTLQQQSQGLSPEAQAILAQRRAAAYRSGRLS